MIGLVVVTRGKTVGLQKCNGMKFLLDENISTTVSRGLRDAGYDVLHVSDTDLARGTDEDIIKFARKKHRIIVTHDKDFGTLLRFPAKVHAGVVLVRLRNQKPFNVQEHLSKFLKTGKKIGGRLIILRESEYRIAG